MVIFRIYNFESVFNFFSTLGLTVLWKISKFCLYTQNQHYDISNLRKTLWIKKRFHIRFHIQLNFLGFNIRIKLYI